MTLLGARTLLVALLAASLAPLATSSPASGVTIYYFHRNGTMDETAPRGSDDALMGMSFVNPEGMRFVSAPLAAVSVVEGIATVRVYVGAALGVQGVVSAVLDFDGVPQANASAHFDGEVAHEIALAFEDLDLEASAGQNLGLFLALEGATGGHPALGAFMLYDSEDHPGRLEIPLRAAVPPPAVVVSRGLDDPIVLVVGGATAIATLAVVGLRRGDVR